MKFHPVQAHEESMNKLSKIFHDAMERHGILPKDPWRAKRLEAWLAKMGAKFRPRDAHYASLKPLDTQNFVNFRVRCPQVVRKGTIARIRGSRAARFVHIEIPWELADKILVLGYLP
jgi:hypothetical protein